MRKQRWGWLLVAMLLVIGLLPACGSDREEPGMTTEMAQNTSEQKASSEPIMNTRDSEDQAVEIAETNPTESRKIEESGTSAALEIDIEDRKVIYHAQLSMDVKHFDDTRDKITALVNESGGYIVQTTQFEETNAIGGHLTVRVPESAFSAFLDQVEKLADKVPHRQVNGSDVTEEYVDLESRLKAKKAVEERLLAFMEDAEKTEDLLKISDDLGQVQEEIEHITGRMQYLDNQVAYSTVDIELTQTVVNRGVSGEDERNTIAAAWSALIHSTNGLLNFFSGFIVFLAGSFPVLVMLVAFGIPFWIWWRKKGRDIFKSNTQKTDE